MAKRILLLSLLVAAGAGTCVGQTAGIYGFAVELDGSGPGAINDGQLTLYGLDSAISGTDSRYLPAGSLATQSAAWTSASNDSNVTFNLGTFNPGAGDTLTLTGGSALTFESGGATINQSDTSLHVSVEPIATADFFLPGINLPVSNTNPSGNSNGDILFATESAGDNLLSGLTPGVYRLSAYGHAYGSTGSIDETDGGLYYAAFFTVVPEPGTWTMIASGTLVLASTRRGWRRR